MIKRLAMGIRNSGVERRKTLVRFAALLVLLLEVPLRASTFVELSHPEFARAQVHDMSQDGSMVVGGLEKEAFRSSPNNKPFAWTPGAGLVVDPWETYGFSPTYVKVSPDGSTVTSGASVLLPDKVLFSLPEVVEDGVDLTPGILAISDNADLAVVLSGFATIDGWLFNPTDAVFEHLPQGNDLFLPQGEDFIFAARDISADGSSVAAIKAFLQNGRPTRESSEAVVLHWQDGWVSQGSGVPEGDYATHPNAISSDGTAVAGVVLEDSDFTSNEAFVWTQSQGFQRLGRLAQSSRANDVADSGAYAVGLNSEDGSWRGRGVPDSARAFIWSPNLGMLDLGTALGQRYGLDEELDGVRLTSASNISGDGMTISGSGINKQGKRIGWVAQLDRPLDATVPEPASLMTLMSGLVGVAIFRRQIGR